MSEYILSQYQQRISTNYEDVTRTDKEKIRNISDLLISSLYAPSTDLTSNEIIMLFKDILAGNKQAISSQILIYVFHYMQQHPNTHARIQTKLTVRI